MPDVERIQTWHEEYAKWYEHHYGTPWDGITDYMKNVPLSVFQEIYALGRRAGLEQLKKACDENEPDEDMLLEMCEAYDAHQSPVDKGYAQHEEGMRLAFLAAIRKLETKP